LLTIKVQTFKKGQKWGEKGPTVSGIVSGMVGSDYTSSLSPTFQNHIPAAP
jgi:hypothetical protein